PGPRPRRARAGARGRGRRAGGCRVGRLASADAHARGPGALRRAARGAPGCPARDGGSPARHVADLCQRRFRGADRARRSRPARPRADALMLGLANPLGLLALASVAVLIALTFLARRTRSTVVSSLLLWKQIPARRIERQRFRPDLLFFLRLLLL